MGVYTEGLKVSIQRQVAKRKTVTESNGFLTSKLSKAFKSYEADMAEVITESSMDNGTTAIAGGGFRRAG